MKNRTALLGLLLLLLNLRVMAQSNTFSPYSRYGLGERAPQTFAHNQGMGGAFIALKPDSTMPIFINAGNPASYPLIRVTAFEVGGKYVYSDFTSSKASARRWGTVFSYAALGFPVGRKGGGSIGIMPYSNVGYNAENTEITNEGPINYQYAGMGGINKAYLGYGIMPFNQRLRRFLIRNTNVPDSVPHLTGGAFRSAHFASKLLSTFSIGANVNYIFGNVQHTARIVYPNIGLYNNTYSERSYYLGGFSGSFGVQTGFSIDSVRSGKGRRALKERNHILLGYFMSLRNPVQINSNVAAYNYIYNTIGQEIVRDTIHFAVNEAGEISLPLEQGIGIGFKKAERLSAVADVAVTFWDVFQGPHQPVALQNSYRTSVGLAFVPEKHASGKGSFFKKTNYRFGAGYESGYVKLAGHSISTAFLSAGLGLPVGTGRVSSMINLSVQVGQTGTTEDGLLKENFVRLHFGFTYCDRWFQKFKYD